MQKQDDRSRFGRGWPFRRFGARPRVRQDRARPAAGPDDWRPVVRGRLLVGLGLFGAWFLTIEARLVHLQVVRHEQLVARAERQRNRSILAHPQRGEIHDRQGRLLAWSVDADTVYAVPTDVDDPAATAAALCGALDACDEEQRRVIERRLDQDRAFAYVERKVSPAAAQRVATLDLDGVGFMKEDRRFYPNRELAGHLIGYVGVDNQGLGGVESTYDDEISGQPGRMLIQTDARRRVFSRVERPPTPGATIELTIDKYLQHVAERELRAAVREHDADGGTVVMLDPETGELLAVASEPNFNPNAFGGAAPAALRNRAVQDVYEPGSVFKLVTTSAALEERLAARDELFDVSAGVIRVGGSRISDMVTYSVLSLEDVIVKSSNVGTIEVGLRVGPERLSDYVRRFGFGQTLTPDLPGESAGIVHRVADLDDQGVASVSMGYQVAVTPLQLAAAVGAVANGGELLAPRAVRAVIRDGVRTATPRRAIRRAIARHTASELTGIMEAVVERGTARAARIPGYTVAGKTGTAEKLLDGRYSDVDHYATFVGFAPSREPVLAMAVTIDTPRGERYTGGAVAAPVFGRVAAAALRYLAVPATTTPVDPALLRLAATPAQTPPPAAPDARSALAAAAVEHPVHGIHGVMPDLRGLSARRALEALRPLRVEVRVDGVGFVASQAPGPGDHVDVGTSAALRLERRPGVAEARSAGC